MLSNITAYTSAFFVILMVPRVTSWENTEAVITRKRRERICFISSYNANMVPMLLQGPVSCAGCVLTLLFFPVPPFEHFRIVLLLGGVVNGTSEDIQQAAVLHNACVCIRLLIKAL